MMASCRAGLAALVLSGAIHSASAAGSCEKDPNRWPDYLSASLCLLGGDTVYAGDDFSVSDRLTPTQSSAKCQQAFAAFARFGIDAKTLAWLGGLGDPRFRPGQDHELVFIPYRCSDGVPRLLVRLHAGTGLLGLHPSWMQFPEAISVDAGMFGPPSDPTPSR
jgi:hypothetical protein